MQWHNPDFVKIKMTFAAEEELDIHITGKVKYRNGKNQTLFWNQGIFKKWP